MKSCILTAFALLAEDPHKRISSIADYVSSMSPDLDRDDVMLAFHLRECFPALTPDAIGRAVTDLVALSRAIHKLDMIQTNDRPLRKAETADLIGLGQRAAVICAEIGVEMEFPDPRSGCGIAVKLPSRRSNNMGGEAWNVLGK